MKTIKELKDGDIVWFVTGTTIKEVIVKNFHIEYIEVFTDNKYINKLHYCFETWLDNKLQYRFYEESEEYGNETDTALKYDWGKDYSIFCHFLNKKDAIKMLKKNIRKAIKDKQKMIRHINKDIYSLELQLKNCK